VAAATATVGIRTATPLIQVFYPCRRCKKPPKSYSIASGAFLALNNDWYSQRSHSEGDFKGTAKCHSIERPGKDNIYAEEQLY
jgi:hypothetical protein